MKVYVDTNVYLDYFFDRKKSEPAFNLFSGAVKCLHQIVLSDLVLYELSKHVDLGDTAVLFKLLEKKIIRITTSEADHEASKLIKSHAADALHAVLAKKGEADVIVTRNIKDFPSFKANRPEDL